MQFLLTITITLVLIVLTIRSSKRPGNLPLNPAWALSADLILFLLYITNAGFQGDGLRYYQGEILYTGGLTTLQRECDDFTANPQLDSGYSQTCDDARRLQAQFKAGRLLAPVLAFGVLAW